MVFKASNNDRFINIWFRSSYNVHMYRVGKGTGIQAEDDGGACQWTRDCFGEIMSVVNGASIP